MSSSNMKIATETAMSVHHLRSMCLPCPVIVFAPDALGRRAFHDERCGTPARPHYMKRGPGPAAHAAGRRRGGERRTAATPSCGPGRPCEPMALLADKRLLITGVLTEGSIAYSVAAAAQREG